MGIGTVSTYAIFQSTLTDVNKAESDLTTEQQQLSSGNATQDFTGMSQQVQQYLSLNANLSNIDNYANNNQIIESRLSVTSSILDQVISTATSLQNLIIQRRSSPTNAASFNQQIQSQWQALAGELNTQVDGQYLFSGTKTNVAPVDPTTFPTLQQTGVPDTGYYHGSQGDLNVRIDDNITITYNVRADDRGIQKVVAALSMALQGSQNNSDTDLSTAENLVQSGLQDVIATQSTVNANKVAMTNIDQNHQTLKLYWQGLQQAIGNTDVVSVSTQVAINQGILQAAFQAFAKINALKLSDYLK